VYHLSVKPQSCSVKPNCERDQYSQREVVFSAQHVQTTTKTVNIIYTSRVLIERNERHGNDIQGDHYDNVLKDNLLR
jgi:hypothetical protein